MPTSIAKAYKHDDAAALKKLKVPSVWNAAAAHTCVRQKTAQHDQPAGKSKSKGGGAKWKNIAMRNALQAYQSDRFFLAPRYGEYEYDKNYGTVVIGLLPALAASIYIFGARAAFLALLCVVACVAFEYFFKVLTKQESTVGDLSAVVTGLILSFNLRSTALLAGGDRMLRCDCDRKAAFRGIGQNFATPP
jgi:hypothetical protein